MKNVLKILFVAIVGGVTSIGLYTFYIEKDQVVIETNNTPVLSSTPVNYIENNRVDFTQAASKTIDAVVHVKNKAIVSTRTPLEEMFYGAGRKRIQVGTGSGVIISPDGYIVTNNHVISGASALEITLNNKKKYAAKIVGVDKANDIALLKVDAENLPHLSFANSDDLNIGEWVLAVGNPYNLTSTVTAGIVSAKGRDLLGSGRTESYIQTDAVVNSGNSGGALVDTNGDLVGINTMITSTTGSYIGYSFAVPSNIAKKIVEDIMEFGDVKRAYIGINYLELTGENYKELGVSNTQGVIIMNVLEGTGAQQAGIKPKDIIIKADHVDVASFADLNGYLNTKRPNDVVNFTIIREGKALEIPVTLFERMPYY